MIDPELFNQPPLDGDVDAKFRYEIIRGLSESVRDLAASMRDVQQTQVGMLERLARLESNRVGESLARVERVVQDNAVRINALESESDRRAGGFAMLSIVKMWAPALFSILTFLYLAGRSAGIIPSPPTTVSKVRAPLAVEAQERP